MYVSATYYMYLFNLSYCVLLQIDYYCRLDCLWKNKFKKEHEQFETMENVNRLLLENVLPAHVAAYFIGEKRNEVGLGSTNDSKLGVCGAEHQANRHTEKVLQCFPSCLCPFVNLICYPGGLKNANFNVSP